MDTWGLRLEFMPRLYHKFYGGAVMDSMEDRIESESQGISRIANLNLRCRDCKFRLDDSKLPRNTSQCERYSMKPGFILRGNDCPKYKKED